MIAYYGTLGVNKPEAIIRLEKWLKNHVLKPQVKASGELRRQVTSNNKKSVSFLELLQSISSRLELFSEGYDRAWLLFQGLKSVIEEGSFHRGKSAISCKTLFDSIASLIGFEVPYKYEKGVCIIEFDQVFIDFMKWRPDFVEAQYFYSMAFAFISSHKNVKVHISQPIDMLRKVSQGHDTVQKSLLLSD